MPPTGSISVSTNNGNKTTPQEVCLPSHGVGVQASAGAGKCAAFLLGRGIRPTTENWGSNLGLAWADYQDRPQPPQHGTKPLRVMLLMPMVHADVAVKRSRSFRVFRGLAQLQNFESCYWSKVNGDAFRAHGRLTVLSPPKKRAFREASRSFAGK